MVNNIYYVYRWIRLDTNTPFYVGKGKGKRFEQTKNQRNQYFKNILKSTECEAEIVIDNLTEDQAFQKEIEFIKLYKDLGYCEANFTIGGDGCSGAKQSDETKLKKSIALKGRIFSKETRKKMSVSQKGKTPWNKGKKGLQASWKRKPVKGINLNTLQDLCFESAQKCAEFFGTKHQIISSICLGKRKPMNDWVLTYLIKEAA